VPHAATVRPMASCGLFLVPKFVEPVRSFSFQSVASSSTMCVVKVSDVPSTVSSDAVHSVLGKSIQPSSPDLELATVILPIKCINTVPVSR